MSSQSSGEKTEKATPKKRREAREKGQVFKSVEVVTSFSLLAMFGVISAFGGLIVENIEKMLRYFFTQKDIPDAIDVVTISETMTKAVIYLLQIMAPLLLGAFICALVLNALQVGLKFSSKAMAPKMERISPLKGFKRIFSMKTLVELIKSVIKITILGLVAYGEYKRYMGEFSLIMGRDVPSAVSNFVDMIIGAAFKMAIALAIFAPFDYLYQRWKYEKDLMMTKQEVRDEYKLTEGNPEIKGKISQKQREISSMRMMHAVKDADVVITNPTHYAIALCYDEEKSSAPFVIAKGKDQLALRIKEKAREEDVAMVENRPLARSLYFFCEVGDEVPEDLYKAVAEVLAYVYHLKNKRGVRD